MEKMSLLQNVRSFLKKQSANALVRERIVEQVVFLSNTGYFKKPITASASARNDPLEFGRFIDCHLSSKSFSKNAELLALHSLVVTALIGWGDHAAVRKSVGKALESALHVRHLASTFRYFPNAFAVYLANLPPVMLRGKPVTSALMASV